MFAIGNKMQLLDVIALMEDIPKENLQRGQVGTIVEILAENVFEVEFVDTKNGHPYAMLPLKAQQLMQLHFEPVDAS